MIDQKSISTLFLLLCTKVLVGQSAYSVDLIPANLLTNANAVVRQHDYTLKIVEEDEAEITIALVVTIFNKSAEDLAWFAWVESSFEKIKYIEGRIFDASGNVVRESKKSDVQRYGGSEDYAYSDGKAKALDLRYGQYPYTVEFKTKKNVKGFFRVPSFDIEHLGYSVQHATYKLNAPAGYEFRWKGVGTDVQPLKTTELDRVEWQWNFDSLPAKPKEVYTPLNGGVYSTLIIAPKNIKLDDHTGVFDNWNHIGRFFYDLNKDRDLLSADMQAKVAELTKGLDNNRDKIRVLYQYLQANHRYISIQIGIGGWQTFDAKFVEEKKYGDCKALSNYMKALLQAAGITAYHTLVFAGDSKEALYEDAPTPVFNHMILYVPKEDIWLECTSQSDPMGYLSDFTDDRQVLLLTPEGGQLVQTPARSPLENTEENYCTILVSAEGNADIKNQGKATGNQHDTYRSWITRLKQAEMEKEFSENLRFGVQKIKSLRVTASETVPEATIQYEISALNYATRSGKRIFVPLLKTHPFQFILPANPKRTLDLKITNAHTYRDTIAVGFPEGFKVENVGSNQKIDSEFGSYDLQITQTAGQITVIRRLTVLPVSVPSGRYAEVRQFYLDIAKLDNVQAVLVSL